jgi:hypothetical protein
MNNHDLSEKKIATLYYNLYKGCINYKKENKNLNKKITCDDYYKLFEKFSRKYYDIADIKDVKDVKDIKEYKH